MAEWKAVRKTGKVDTGDIVVDVGIEINGIQRLSIYKEGDDDDDDREAIAAQIVLEHNSHEALVEALDCLRELVDIVEGVREDGDSVDSFTLLPAKAALAAAEVK